MYKLSDTEAYHAITNADQPLAWATLSSAAVPGAVLTEALLKRAYACVSCRNPLLRSVYEPENDLHFLRVRDVADIARAEAEGELPVHYSHEFHTRDEAWAEYKRKVEAEWWECRYMWAVDVYVLDREPSRVASHALIFHVNHAAADGAGMMVLIDEFVSVLNKYATCMPCTELPALDCLGGTLPIPEPFLIRFPKYKFVDALPGDESTKLFTEVAPIVRSNKKNSNTMVFDKTLSEATTLSFIGKCKEHGVSVTAAFYALFAIASKAKRIVSDMPISLRVKETSDVVADYFTDALLDMDVSSFEPEDVWGMAAAFNYKIHHDMVADKDKGYAVEIAKSATKPFPQVQTSIAAEDGVFFFCFSNIGRVDAMLKNSKDSDCWAITEITAGCENSPGTCTIVWCTTFRNRFRFSCVAHCPPLTHELFESLMNSFLSLVEQV